LSDLELLSDTEKHQLLHDWNNTGHQLPDQTLPQLFETQAARTPEAVAVVHGQTSLTYRELDARANQLAHHLRHRGVSAGTLVGVCAERGPELIVGLLGILKSGGAYVPLDPEHPAPRLDFMLRDTEASLVLVQSNLRDRLSGYGGDLVDLEPARQAHDARPEVDPARVAGPDDLAYVIYTSGSTGAPKGVQVEHGSVVNYLEFMRDFTRLEPDDVVAQTSPISFDMFVYECWLPLSTGARLVVIEKNVLLNPDSFAEAIRDQKISVVRMTASLFNQHLTEYPELASGLRVIAYGGEAVERSVADRVIAGPHAPEMVLHTYGPTETTVSSVVCAVTGDTPESRTMPIGRPVANTRVYVVDRFGKPTPIGVP
ncbi:hypothetical protein BLA60_41800, partial [Actinophytocola xinjiangensis]